MLDLQNYIVWQPDPVFFHIGSYSVRYYAVCWAIGLTLGYFLMMKLYKQQQIPDEKFDPLMFYIFFGALIGSRLGHCLFYEPDYFLSSGKHLIEMFVPIHFLPEGGIKVTGYAGLASHGGVIGLLIAIWLYCCNTKVPGWVVLDNMGICSGIAAAFIRLGNLMNSEIVGKVTDVPWAFIFLNGDPSIAHEPRHPGQLYEAITYILIFTTILLIYRHKGPKSVGSGLYFGICLTLIFVARFFIEYTKEIQEAFEAGLPIDMGQILSIPLIAIGIWAIVSSRHRVTTMNFKK